MKNINKINILSLITTIISFITIYYLLKLDVLPLKYFIIIILIILLALVLGIIFLNRKNKALKIIGIIILSFMIIGNCFTIYHMKNIDNFFNKSFKTTNTQKISYYVIALSKNNYKAKDISGSLGYYENSINIKSALKKLNDKYEIEDYNYSEINKMFEHLNSEELKFVLLEKTNYNIIKEFDVNFPQDNYEIITEFTVLKKITTTNNEIKNSFNIYVGGTDYAGLMDFNTIITINMDTHKILLTSIPRDTYVDVYGYNYKNKLSFIIEGIDVSKNSLANFFGIDIDYYVKIDADSVVKLINEIGGIEYCSDYDYNGAVQIYENGKQKSISYHIKKGCQQINGYQAIAASRNRNSFAGRDRVRQKNMQKIIIAIFKKIATPEVLGNYESTLDALADTYQTDIPRKLITKNIKDIINNGNKWEIETQSIDGDDTMGSVHRFDYLTDWILIPNMDTVNSASTKIKEVLK